MKKEKSKKWPFIKISTVFILISFFVIELRMAYIALSPNVDGINIQEFASRRNTTKKILRANRGVIYDASGDVLARNVTSYTVVAILSSSRSDRIQNVEEAATKLSPVLNMDKTRLVKLLSQNLYQVELGPEGRGITIQKKEEVEALDITGIEFIEDTKRNYPNGDFASYIVGYAKTYVKDNSKVIIGELGIEGLYNKELTGTDGYFKYEQDTSGRQIPDTPEERVDAKNGNDIYLTIDSNIERFTESAMKELEKNAKPEWAVIALMDAKTGAILASSTTPSFNPNKLNITNYENPLVSYAFEPGSTMKTYSYMCAIEKGTYEGTKTFESGIIKIEGGGTIKDWNTKGFGTISFDKGFEYSSNTGAVNLMRNFITKQELLDCYKKYGFGEKTGVELSRELSGKISFNYDLEVANATFGQGITTTPIQHLQGLSIIANNGKMLKPYIVKKIVNTSTSEIVYEGKKQESERLVSIDTVNKMKELLKDVVEGKDVYTTGSLYYRENLGIIGKTGTGEIWNNQKGSYESGGYNYIYSFAGMFPYDDPQIIVYAAMKKPTSGPTSNLSKLVKTVASDVSKYLDLSNVPKETLSSFGMKNYFNKDINDADMEGVKLFVIGNGNKIIDQYPSVNTMVVENDVVILKTNGKEIKMPSFIGLSLKETKKLCSMLGITCDIEGNGYVINQDIKENTIIDKEMIVKLVLKEKE
ncbi:cell division protein FtsI/penicillin-binding protein 2 [Firmicutes bacterium CAG:884]|nr:cell division protein FtsI/penicillin-binding protein 2 [Firmicutes bacterium CAG:884]